MAGVQQMVEYLNNLSFTEEDIAYLESKKLFKPEFLDYLRNFHFTCDVWAVPEGTPIFPPVSPLSPSVARPFRHSLWKP